MAEMATKVVGNRCEVCQVNVGSRSNMKAHVNGKKHTNMVLRLNAKKKVGTTVPMPGGMTEMATKITVNRCEICQINVGNKLNLEQHLNGKKHAQMVSQLNVQEKKVDKLVKEVDGHGSVTGANFTKTNVNRPRDIPHLDGGGCSILRFPGMNDFDSQAFHLMARHEVPYDVRNAKCMKLCGDIEEDLQHLYPKGRATAFGSVVTGLACHDSDIDVYFCTDFVRMNSVPSVKEIPRNTEQSMVKTVRRVFGSRFPTYQSVFAIPSAKVALVKFFHMPTQVNCDLSFKNGIGVCNSVLIHFYLSLDPRIKPLLMVLKHWGKVYELTGTGHITNYALVWMVLYFLQQLQEPVVPTVAALQRTNCNKHLVNGWDCSFSSDGALRWHTTNKSTIHQLLLGFFKFYSRFDQELFVICPLLGCTLPKNIFCHMEKLPLEMATLKDKVQRHESVGLKIASTFCIQDPFVLEHNVTVSVSRNLMAKFQSLCLAAESICRSQPQLQVLLENCAEVNTAKENFSVIVIFSSKKFVANLVQASADGFAEDLRSVWYGTVYESLIDIFENVLKLNVRDVSNDTDGTEAKVRRLDSHSDVSDSADASVKDFSKTRILKCSACFCVWKVYKTSSRDYHKLKTGSTNKSCVQKMTVIEQQKAITNFIMDNFSEYFDMQQPDETNSVVSFTCEFIPEQNPIHVSLKFSCDRKDLRLIFVPLLNFLKKNLLKWIQES